MFTDSNHENATRKDPASAGVHTPGDKPAKVKRKRTRMTWTVAGHKIKKPYPDFPLTPHASGAWKKRIGGRVVYFGRWARWVDGKLERIPGDGWEAAEEKLKEYVSGKPGRVDWDSVTLADVCNYFLTAKKRKLDAGEMTPRMMAEYKEVTDLMVATFGKAKAVHALTPEDFAELRAKMAERWGPVRLVNGITRVKSVFKHAADPNNNIIDRLPRYGSDFKKPDKTVLRRHRAQRGEKMIEADQLRKLIGVATGQQRAMILLGVNCGYGNMDLACLPLSAVNLETSWINYPRPKTGIARRCPLWQETVQAIRDALAVRPEPKTDTARPLVFVTSRGTPWIHHTAKSARVDNITIQFTRLVQRLEMHKEGVGFYALRHVFRTIADGARDPIAADIIMGHSTDGTMAGHYRERVEDARLVAVTNHVHGWLFGEGQDGDRADEQEPTPNEGDEEENIFRPTSANDRPKLRVYVG